MRIFMNFKEALGEIKRDLSEMGINLHPQTMQDKYVGDDEDYKTKEIQNYIYTVLSPVESLHHLSPVQPWADNEFRERISARAINPGEAYLDRFDVWEEFLHDGQFAYTYNERMRKQLNRLIDEAQKRPESRQLFLSIWDPSIDNDRMGGTYRVPCSLGYLFQIRDGKLNMTYFMRSCDFATHMQNDMYLAVRLMEYVAMRLQIPVGNFTHYFGSLHIYSKDTEGVF